MQKLLQSTYVLRSPRLSVVWMPYYYIQAKNNHPSFIISGSVIIWAEAQPELNTFPRTALRNFIQLPFIGRTSFPSLSPHASQGYLFNTV